MKSSFMKPKDFCQGSIRWGITAGKAITIPIRLLVTAINGVIWGENEVDQWWTYQGVYLR